MSALLRHFDALLLTLWVGALWSIGYLAVPVLFQAQPDKQLAGMLAGEMFGVLGYVAIACGGYLLLRQFITTGNKVWRQPVFLMVAAMLVLSLLIQFGIQPLMAELKTRALPLEVMQSGFSGRFAMWHGISSILYLIESLLGAALVLRYYRS